jgi:hypothetical protein
METVEVVGGNIVIMVSRLLHQRPTISGFRHQYQPLEAQSLGSQTFSKKVLVYM